MTFEPFSNDLHGCELACRKATRFTPSLAFTATQIITQHTHSRHTVTIVTPIITYLSLLCKGKIGRDLLFSPARSRHAVHPKSPSRSDFLRVSIPKRISWKNMWVTLTKNKIEIALLLKNLVLTKRPRLYHEFTWQIKRHLMKFCLISEN